jgi:hypothetical protein
MSVFRMSLAPGAQIWRKSVPTCDRRFIGSRSQISRYHDRLAAVTVTARILAVIGE